MRKKSANTDVVSRRRKGTRTATLAGMAAMLPSRAMPETTAGAPGETRTVQLDPAIPTAPRPAETKVPATAAIRATTRLAAAAAVTFWIWK